MEDPSAVPAGLVDQHSAGVLHGELGLGTFEQHLGRAAGARGPAPAGVTHFDTPLGRAVRRWCPPLLGLEPHCPASLYLARRRELGAFRAGRLLLHGAGIGAFVTSADDPGDLAAAGRVHALVRLEPLARQVAATSGSVEAFLRYAAEAVYAAAQDAAAFAVGAGGVAEWRPPAGFELRGAAAEYLAAERGGRGPSRGGARDDPGGADRDGGIGPVLVRHLLWSALASGVPVQLHGGDPAGLAELVDRTAGLGTDLVLVPDPPHRRAAARLAAAYPHVYADTGTDPGPALRLAPAGKLLFSTGARALPELYVVGARAFRGAVARLTEEWLAEGACSARDAERAAAQVGAGTARRVYRLPARR